MGIITIISVKVTAYFGMIQ